MNTQEEEMDDSTPMEEDEIPEEEKKVYMPGDQLEEGEHLVPDESAYRLLQEASTTAPCLSFDIIPDMLGNSRETYPMSMYLLAGTQAAKTHVNNLLVMKITNLHGKSASESDDEESSDEEDDEESSPKMQVATARHQGCVNRIRYFNKAFSYRVVLIVIVITKKIEKSSKN